METQKTEGRKIRSRARWHLLGDKLTADFFNTVKESPNTSSITELRDSQGILHHDLNTLEHLCTDFYTKLYTTESITPEILSDREAILSCMSSRFPPSIGHQLEGPFTEQELYHALKQMAKGRSPGPDGITVDFFCQYWNLIGSDFTDMVHQAVSQGHLPSGMTSGTIALIFKAGDCADLSNWCPITLLNVSYKIIAKALQIRLQPLLHDVISMEQFAFLPNRHILCISFCNMKPLSGPESLIKTSYFFSLILQRLMM